MFNFYVNILRYGLKRINQYINTIFKSLLLSPLKSENLKISCREEIFSQKLPGNSYAAQNTKSTRLTVDVPLRAKELKYQPSEKILPVNGIWFSNLNLIE